MTEDEIRAEARLYALECVVCQMFALLHLQIAGTGALSALERQRQQAIQGAKQKTFPELRDPGLSDLMSAELEAAVGRLADMEKALLEGVLRASGNPGFAQNVAKLRRRLNHAIARQDFYKQPLSMAE